MPKNLLAILVYRVALIGALMYTVGHLGWSTHWLWLLITLPTFDGKIE